MEKNTAVITFEDRTGGRSFSWRSLTAMGNDG